jgi:putative flippase GtrA
MIFSAQFLRFGVVGTAGFVIDASVLQLLISQFDGNLYISRIFSYLVAASVTWIMHRHYTFRENLVSAEGVNTANAYTHLAWQWTRFVVTNFLGALVNYGVYALCIFNWLLFRNYPVLAVAAGSVVGLIFNYTASRHLVFNRSVRL